MSFYTCQQTLDLPSHHADDNAITKPGSLPAVTTKVKPTKRSCSVVGCTNGVVQGGVCVSHGAKRRLCLFPGEPIALILIMFMYICHCGFNLICYVCFCFIMSSFQGAPRAPSVQVCAQSMGEC